jgi:16S rRNA (guanine527-N7)-methyltransferase
MQIGSEKWRQVLIQGAADLQVELTPQMCAQLTIYAQQLLIWSEKINLTAISDPYQVAVKHFVDCMAPARWLGQHAGLLDIGSGGGFPGLPLKILRPDLKVVLIDAVRKKVSFMQHVIRLLDLKEVAAYHLRADEMAALLAAKHRTEDKKPVGGGHIDRLNGLPPASFDVIISRALTSLKAFVEMSLPLLSEGGTVIALKGQISTEELSEADAFLKTRATAAGCGKNAWELKVSRYYLPYINDRRCIVSIRRKG